MMFFHQLEKKFVSVGLKIIFFSLVFFDEAFGAKRHNEKEAKGQWT